jgi:hypothetical protein
MIPIIARSQPQSARGRATGVNAYPAINDAFMAAIEAMPTA